MFQRPMEVFVYFVSFVSHSASVTIASLKKWSDVYVLRFFCILFEHIQPFLILFYIIFLQIHCASMHLVVVLAKVMFL